MAQQTHVCECVCVCGRDDHGNGWQGRKGASLSTRNYYRVVKRQSGKATVNKKSEGNKSKKVIVNVRHCTKLYADGASPRVIKEQANTHTGHNYIY